MARPRPVPRRARALLGAAFALVLLGMVEVGLRLAGVAPAYNPEALGQWRMSPNLHDRAARGPRDQHTFTLSTNADGLRTTLPRDKPPGRTRVALMGDSTLFGWGVDDGSTVADGAQAALGDAPVDVLNAGQPGYSTTMAAWLFGQVMGAYAPDLTIVFVPMHDTNLVLVSDRELLDGGATLPARVRVWLARESRIYVLLRGLLFSATDKAWVLPDEAGGEPRVPRVSDAERTRALDEMAEAARAWGGKVAVGYLPFKRDIDTDFEATRPTTAWAREYTSSRGVGLYELQTCCHGGVDYVLPDDPGHLTRAGNFAAGAALAARLRTELGAPP